MNQPPCSTSTGPPRPGSDPAGPATSPSAKTGAIRSALVIDDEAFERTYCRRVIERSGLVGTLTEYTMATDAIAAMKSGAAGSADVIFLDVNMPRMTGIEFLEEAVQALAPGFAQLVVVMLTVPLDPVLSARLDTLPLDVIYVPKPLTVDHIEQASHRIAQGQAG